MRYVPLQAVAGRFVRTAIACALAGLAATPAQAEFESEPVHLPPPTPPEWSEPAAGFLQPVAAVPASTGGAGDFSALLASSKSWSDTVRQVQVAPAAARLAGSRPSSMPVRMIAFTSGFGLRIHPIIGDLRNHDGVDIAANPGSPIVATAEGVVGEAGWRGGYGLLVSLAHGGGVETRYGHMSRLNVITGQRIHKGDVIGFVGSTGNSTGPHLHYEVRISGRPVNPMPYLVSATPFAIR